MFYIQYFVSLGDKKNERESKKNFYNFDSKKKKFQKKNFFEKIFRANFSKNFLTLSHFLIMNIYTIYNNTIFLITIDNNLLLSVT